MANTNADYYLEELTNWKNCIEFYKVKSFQALFTTNHTTINNIFINEFAEKNAIVASA